ncbi:MAG: sulfatase, partial [Thermoanaerobaculia bacterium]
LDLATESGEPIAISRIEAVKSVPRPDLAPYLTADNWKVELDHDVRNAVLTVSGKEISWMIFRSGPLRLRFSYGKLAVGASALRFRVSQAVPDGPRTTLFEEILDSSKSGDSDRWHEAEVELESTRKVRTIIFESGPVDTDTLDGVAVWANPELVPVEGSSVQPSIVLISLDTLRADRLSLYGYPETTSPNLKKWAEEDAIVFLNAVAAAPRTLPSHASLFSGIDALRHGANFYSPISQRLDLLPEILRSEGYKTLAITGGGVMHPDFGLAQGFDEYSYWPDWAGGPGELEDGLRLANEKLSRNSNRPVFLFFHTYEIHDPYVPRPPYSDRCYETPAAQGQEKYMFGARPSSRSAEDGFQLHYRFIKWERGTSIGRAVPATESDLPLINCLYDSGVAFTDNRIGQFLSHLRKGPGAEQRIIVLTSDHGESLGEQGRAKHAYLSDTNLMVPLVFRIPGLRTTRRRIEDQVSLVDVAPTILELVSSSRAIAMDGESLVPLILGQQTPESERRAWSYAANENRGLGVRLGDQLKYIFNNTAWEPALGSEELYDLRRDPFEQTNLEQSRSDLAEYWRSETVDYISSAAPGVQVWFRHRGCGTLEGEIAGRAVGETTIKAVDIPPGGLDWSKPSTLKVHVVSGESFGIVVEEVRGSLDIEFRISGCPDTSEQPFHQRLEIEDMKASWSLTRRAGGWRVLEEVDNSDGTLVTLIPNLLRPVSQPGDDVAEDPVVLEQLRALGYIN